VSRALAGRYRILERIAEGGMARVFLGEDLRQGRKVALKMLRPELAREREWGERFRAEANVLGRLHHPNVIRLHDFLRDGDGFCMVLEYAPGETLADLLLRHPDGLPWRKGVALIGQVLSALHHCHERGIVHRDIKPANLVVRAGGSVKLTDFGIARVRGAGGLTRTGFMSGTLKYMSPEQIRAQTQDGRSDLYSAALVLYEMLCGRPAFDEPTEYELIRAQVEAPPPPLREWRPDLPPRLESLILRALHKDPAERFDSAGEFRQGLEDVLREESCPDACPSAAGMAPRDVRPDALEPTVVLSSRLFKAEPAEKAF
jgi:serine/threonine protein kinase